MVKEKKIKISAVNENDLSINLRSPKESSFFFFVN